MNQRVWFPEEQSEIEICHPCIPLRSELSAEEQRQIWYQPADYEKFKLTSRAIAKETRRCGYARLLDDVYEDTNQSSTIALARWSRHGLSTRGVERLCNPQHGSTRKIQQKECVRQVLMAQASLEKEKTSSNIQERIAQVSAKYSRNARSFASRMGMADAIGQLEKPEPSCGSALRNSSTIYGPMSIALLRAAQIPAFPFRQ